METNKIIMITGILTVVLLFTITIILLGSISKPKFINITTW